jgi:hypothetical protein
MKTHLTERGVKGLQPKQKNTIVYDEEVVGFGVRITSGGTRAFILTYRIETRERRLTIGAWPDWSVTAAREEAKRLKREIDQGRDPMAERDEARESPNMRQLIDRYLEEHAAKLAKRNRDDQASMLRKLVEPSWGPRKAAEIQPEDVDKLLRQIASGTPGKKGRKPTPVRANRVGEILRKMFNLAIRWRVRTDNPAAGFARNAEAPRDRYLSTDEIARLSVALDGHSPRQTALRKPIPAPVRFFPAIDVCGRQRRDPLPAAGSRTGFAPRPQVRRFAPGSRRNGDGLFISKQI